VIGTTEKNEKHISKFWDGNRFGTSKKGKIIQNSGKGNGIGTTEKIENCENR